MHLPDSARKLALTMGLGWSLLSPRGVADTPPQTAVKDLITEQVPEFTGHELNMLTVTYPPGGSSKPHRHDAYVLVYVLEGAVEMKVKGSPLRTVKAGETFVEHPADIHEVSRNASADKPATFLVVALKESARPLSRAAPAEDSR